jgi:hypothetical protein
VPLSTPTKIVANSHLDYVTVIHSLAPTGRQKRTSSILRQSVPVRRYVDLLPNFENERIRYERISQALILSDQYKGLRSFVHFDGRNDFKVGAALTICARRIFEERSPYQNKQDISRQKSFHFRLPHKTR